ncbi:hypothetical protein NNJEOMEG_01798 [Fundidesulfovibrio magnetotacticus]|uniref:DUF547 domain-containing protein n=1 Tax=Fundidesulfovibrio magnetotacticus TaxID=2730080 RepID=A0A6V8LSM1_9BACT|nr:DUF547 domain-containing protein [Fundidesulfovibrio magnetotacticus]GFK93960.1 hypothetical protein NNJEOMEG_01798 [Fundidesulfovibrio magnetotacticus]
MSGPVVPGSGVPGSGVFGFAPTARLLAALLALCLCCAPPARAADDAPYARVLAAHVRGGLVDYPALKADRADLDAYLEGMAAVDLEALPRAQALAAAVNLYNAATLALVRDHWPVASIRDIGGLFGSPWKIRFVRTARGLMTLDELEHGFLRPRFGESRVHAALNCASRGCPPLAGEPFEAARLDEQLDRAARAMLSVPDRARLEGATLHVSAIFDWYSDDFGGKPGVIAFVARHAPPELAGQLAVLDPQAVTLKFLPYDWSVNGPPPGR